MKTTSPTMTTQDVVDACWEYATSPKGSELRRTQIAERIAAHLGKDVERVEAVLRLHRGRVDGIYLEAGGQPSLASLVREDEAVSDALDALPEVVA